MGGKEQLNAAPSTALSINSATAVSGSAFGAKKMSKLYEASAADSLSGYSPFVESSGSASAVASNENNPSTLMLKSSRDQRLGVARRRTIAPAKRPQTRANKLAIMQIARRPNVGRGDLLTPASKTRVVTPLEELQDVVCEEE
ncbi:hypothetical protein DVR14_23960 (plasmid) [Natrinema thermotolerans]|nr:hypothetical protein DVR14_19830 [Natrinema thermotolerans]QCC61643.1 hypothetical protein DVR14_23960 [Natrinema thermotolerans]WPH65860.1 hypothetical protein HJTV4_gp37 [Haloarchaeal virus HJTV-4]